jgi:hypothetical protein
MNDKIHDGIWSSPDASNWRNRSDGGIGKLQGRIASTRGRDDHQKASRSASSSPIGLSLSRQAQLLAVLSLAAVELALSCVKRTTEISSSLRKTTNI